MSAKNYKDAHELLIPSAIRKGFEDSVKKTKEIIRSYGFSKEAVDRIDFSLTSYALVIQDKERRSGAFHPYADGKPFYEMGITTAGSLMELAGAAPGPHTARDAKQQALMLFFELGMNVAAYTARSLVEKYSQKEDAALPGGSMPLDEAVFDTAFRCEPKLYLTAFNELLDARLAMLAPKTPAAGSAPAIKQRGPGLK
jgi:hypothetical protein